MSGDRGTPTKVVLVSDSFHPWVGGGERQMQLTLARLDPARWDITVVTRRLGDAPATSVVDGLRVRRVGTPTPSRAAAVRYLLGAARAVVRERPDVVIALQIGSSALAATAGARLARRARPLVVRLAGGSLAGTELQVRARSRVGRVTTRLVLRAASAVVAPSAHLLEAPPAFAGALADKGRVIPNGVAVPPDLPPVAERDGVIWVGRDDPVKGFDDFLALARALPDESFVAAGPAARSDAPGNLRCLGWVDDVPGTVAHAAAFVSTSRHEGISNAMLEALAAGVPVVAYDIEGNQRLAAFVDAGLRLVAVGDVGALTSAVRAVLRDRPAVQAHLASFAETAAEWGGLLAGLADAAPGHGSAPATR